MNLSAIIAALRGAKDMIFVVVALILLAAVGVQTWRLSASEKKHDAYVDRMIAATAKAAQAAAKAREKALEAREAYLWKSGEAENAYEAGRQSAINAQSVLVDDLRHERVRLQQQWRGCESSRVREGQPVAGAAQGSDADADLRAKGASYLIGNADQADVTIQWFQAELLATRELYSKCMVPKDK